MARTFDARAWLAWVLGAGVATMLLRNPLYTLLLLLISRIVLAGCGRGDDGIEIPIWRLAAVILLFSTAFNGLLVHSGATVLFRLAPEWPLIGGPITAEAVVSGLQNGLILLTLISLFWTFNRVIEISELVRIAPRAFYDLGVVVVIALTYVPQTIQHWRQIKEAQAVRGHRLRGLRDWQPLVAPLFIGGLERAMGLAEAMAVRGYAGTAGRGQDDRQLAGLLGALGAASVGWLLLVWEQPAGWALVGGGTAVMALLIHRAGHQRRHTRYRSRSWSAADTALVLCSALAIVATVFAPAYNPFPMLTMPDFAVGAALCLLALLFPAFYQLTERTA